MKSTTKTSTKNSPAPKGKAPAKKQTLSAPAKKEAKAQGKKLAADLMKKIAKEKPSTKKSTPKDPTGISQGFIALPPAPQGAPAKLKLPPKPGERMIALSIFGPNLSSKEQQLGQFHVHTQDCKDCEKFRKRNMAGLPEYKESHSSAESVTRSIYGDQIREGATLEECQADIYFAPCVKFDEAKPTTPIIPPAIPPAPVPAPAPLPIIREFKKGDLVLMDGVRLASITEAPADHGTTGSCVIRAQGEPQDWTINVERLILAPASAFKKKRYESKTDPTSNYHNCVRSTCEKPIATVKRICQENPGKARKDVLALCIAAGVNPSTAATQYSLWKVAAK